MIEFAILLLLAITIAMVKLYGIGMYSLTDGKLAEWLNDFFRGKR